MKGKRSLGCFGGLLVIVIAIAALALINRFIPSFFSTMAWIVGIVVAVLIIVMFLILFLANKAIRSLKKDKNKTPPPVESTASEVQEEDDDLTPEQRAILNNSSTELHSVMNILSRIHNTDIRVSGTETCTSLDRIIKTLYTKPEKITGCRQFLNYYIPTLGEVFSKYHRLESGGVVTEENTESVKKFLMDFKKAAGRQYQSLFDDDKLDMSVDMEAMTIALKREGLLNETIFDEAAKAVKETEDTLVH